MRVIELVLAVLRLTWRFGNPLPAWKRRLVTLVHWVLYPLIFIVPLSGWWVSTVSGVPFKACLRHLVSEI